MSLFEQIIRVLQFEMDRPKIYGWFHLSCLALTVLTLMFLMMQKERNHERRLKVVLLVYGIGALFLEAAERYLNAVMNGKTGIPLKAWKSERDKLNGEKKELTQQYYALKEEVKEVEQIRRNVYSILKEEGREQPTRKHEHER